MKQKITLILCILIFQFLSGHAQKWLWGAEGNTFSDNFGVAADNSGNAYLAGFFSDTVSFGSQSLNSLSADAFLIKYDSSGKLLWAKQSESLTASSYCTGAFICSDNQKNICYTGLFHDTVCFGKDTLGMVSTGYFEIFLTKYDSNGNVIWARQSAYHPFYSDWQGPGIAIDHSNNIFLAGTFMDAISFGPDSLQSNAITNTFLVKYDAGGNVIWARQPISNSYSGGVSVAVDDSGNSYITGSFGGSVTFGKITLNSISQDVFLAKYDNNGNVRWAVQSKSLSQSSSCNSSFVIADAANNIYITGVVTDTVSFGLDTLINGPQNNFYASQLFLVKYNSDGKILWAKQSEGSQGWVGYSLAIDKINQIYLSGGGAESQQSDTFIYHNDTLRISNPTDPSIILKLDTAGHLLCGSILSTGGDDRNGIACSSSGYFVYLGGDIASNISFGSDFLIRTANENPFIARWQSCCNAPVSLTGNSFLCKGSNSVLYTSGGGSYSWNTGSTNDSILIHPDTTTTYLVSIENAGCTYLISKTVGVTSGPVITLCCDTLIQDGENVQLTSGGGAFYAWSPATGLNCDTCSNPIANPSQTTTYTLTVMNDSGCISTRTVTIDVRCGDVFIPDIFSPNQNVNNILYVRGPCISTLDFMVFDRWGNKVYETQNKNDGWDGAYGGQPMNTATYMYYAKATMYDGSVVEKKGSVALVR